MAIKIKKLKNYLKKSRLLLEKGPAYQNDIDYLTIKLIWYVKESNHKYRFMLWAKIIEQYNYKYKFWDTVEKKISEIVKFIRHFLILLEKVLCLRDQPYKE